MFNKNKTKAAFIHGGNKWYLVSLRMSDETELKRVELGDDYSPNVVIDKFDRVYTFNN